MNSMDYNRLVIYFLALAFINIVACSHSRSLSSTTSEKDYFPEVGDDVVVVLKSGETHKFFITEITPDSIKSNIYKFSKDEMVSIKPIESNFLRGFGVTVGILGTVVSILVIYFLFNLDSISG